MKTKSFVWLMALVMSLALVGCKGNDGNTPDDPSKEGVESNYKSPKSYNS